MNQKQQILENVRKRHLTLIDETYQTICNKLLHASTQGVTGIEYFFPNSYHTVPDYGNEVIKKLVADGYYVRTGWRETTPNGNDKAFMLVSVEPFPEPTFWQRYKTYICVGIIALICMCLLCIIC